MIPAEQYSFIYTHLMLVLVFITLVSYAQGGHKGFNRIANIVIPSFLILYIGTRPLSPVFIDMTTYAQSFEVAARGGGVFFSEWLFKTMMDVLSQVTTVEVFFFICALLYVLPIVAGLTHRHGRAGFAATLATITSFSFFAYGVNGIRNGIATSILLAAIAWSDRKIVYLITAFVAYNMHSSVAAPALFFLLTFLNANVILYACLWFLTLLFNAATGGSAAAYLSGLMSSSDELRMSYLTQQGEDKGGFRLDFVLYSIVPVIISYLWAKPQIRRDLFYRRILCAYLATNAFWLLVMYAAFSNRFAYLSWFMMPWVIIYPFIPNNTNRTTMESKKWDVPKFAAMLGGQFALTYLFNIIIYPNR